MENFKAIPILSAPEFSPERLQKIKSLFAGFPDTDIRFEWKEKGFAIFLHALDFQRFNERLLAFAENGESDEELKNFSLQILEAVDSIRSYGLKGEKRLYSGYNDERKVKGRAKKVADREPYFYATGHGFSKSNHACPPAYKNKIICGDSEEILKELPDNCVDLIFTSPAYNFGLEYASNGDAAHWESYFEKLFRIFSECVRVLKYGGTVLVNMQPQF